LRFDLKQFDPRITFTRASTASYTDSDGLVKQAAVNAPRFDHDPLTKVCKGLLIEDQRTNLYSRSQEFNDSFWTKSRVTISQDVGLAPDGTLTMDKLIEDTTASNSHLLSATVSVTSGVIYTQTIYAKAGERTWFLMLFPSAQFGVNYLAYFNLETGTVGTVSSGATASITHVGNGIYRCALTPPAATSTGSATITAARLATGDAAPTYTGDGVSGIYIWGAQFEAGASPSSYIPTTSAQATRSAELAYINGTNFSNWYRADEGTFVSEFDVFGVASGFDATVFSVNNGTQNEQIDMRAFTTGVGGRVRLGGANQASFTFPPVPTMGARYKVATTYKLNDANNAVNGSVGTTDTACPLPVGINRLEIGARVSGALLNGHISFLSYYPKRLSNTELQGLTT
jgi:hypothetical protein